MFTFILLNKDKIEKSRVLSEYEPGYEKSSDGNFYKIDGDERLIEEEVEVTRVYRSNEDTKDPNWWREPYKQKKTKNAVKVIDMTGLGRERVAKSRNLERNYEIAKGVLVQGKPLSENSFLNSMIRRGEVIKNGIISLFDVEIKGECPLKYFPNSGKYKKIDINVELGTIKVWNDNPISHPNAVYLVDFE